MNNNKSNKKTDIKSWPSKLNAWCDGLNEKQRIRLILILSAVYFLLTVTVLSWIYFGDSGKKGLVIKHIQAPTPMLRQNLKIVIPKESDSTSTSKKEDYGKE